MGEELRKSGIDVMGDIPWGTHFCQFYQTKEDLTDILGPYFKAGLENNEFCLWIISQPLEVGEAKEALRKYVPDLDTYLENGQIEIRPYASWYTKNGFIDLQRVLKGWIEINSKTLASGYDGLRLSLNTFWLEETDCDYFVDHEEEVNSIIDRHNMIALCTYSLDKCSAIEIINTVSSHQFVLAKKEGKWERIENVGKKTAEEAAIRAAEKEEIKLGEAYDNPEKLLRRIMQLEKAYILLKESEKGLAEAQRISRVGSWDLDIATEESKWSDEMHRIFGLDPQEFGPTDKTFLRYVHPDDREYVNNAIQDALKGKPYSIDYRIILVNGEESTVHEQREITFDKKDIPVRIIGTIQDIAGRKKIEKALKIARDYNRSLIDSSLDLLFVTDPEGKITDLNKAAGESIGYLREELIGTDITNYFTDPEQTREDYQEVFRKGSVLNRELEIKHKDGHITPVFYNFSVRMNESGEIIGVFAAAHDITERKKAEEAIKKIYDSLEEKVKARTAELEEAYESLLENEIRLSEAQKMAHIGNWEWSIATDKTYWSDEMYRIFGRDPTKLAPPYNEYLSYIHPDDRDYFDNSAKRAVNGESYSIDYRIILSDREERAVHMQYEVIFDAENIPIRMKGTVQDITERKRMEDSLRQSKALLSAVLEQLPVGLGLADTQGRLLVTNNMLRRFVSGGVIPSSDPENSWRWRTWGVDGRLLERPEWPNARALQGENITAGLDFLYTFDEGREIWTRISSVPFRNEAGEITGTISVIQDIDEQKRIEEALEKIEKTRIKEIHHRIKNNLQVISSLLSLQAEKFSDTKMLEAFRESQNRVASMALIHEELYEGDKIDTFDFAAYIHKLTSHLFSSYNVNNNNNVSLKLDIGQIYLNMDPAIPLGIIVNELVSNALKHAFPAGSEGEIYISLSKAETPATKHDISDSDSCYMEKNSFNYVLTVADNGKGIPEEIEFQNADSLGLQLVNILVEQLDGCMELKRNHGTEFIIWFNNMEK